MSRNVPTHALVVHEMAGDLLDPRRRVLHLLAGQGEGDQFEHWRLCTVCGQFYVPTERRALSDEDERCDGRERSGWILNIGAVIELACRALCSREDRSWSSVPVP